MMSRLCKPKQITVVYVSITPKSLINGFSIFNLLFLFYTDVRSTGAEKCTDKSIVTKLCENISRGYNYKVFYDNLISTLDLSL